MDHFIPSFTLEGFYLGPLYIYTWGITTALGVLAGILVAQRNISKKSISENSFWNFSILLVIAIFLGARLSYILETWSYYAIDFTRIFQVWNGGFSFFGGAIGAILVGWLWSRKNKISFLEWGAIFTPAWIFGLMIGRVGCFLIHDHLGKTTDLPWGIWIQGAYRHEPALYEILILLLIGLILIVIEKYSVKNLSKILFPLSLILYSISRFFLDFIRALPAQGGDDRFYSFTVAQWVAILLLFLSGIIIWNTYGKEKTQE